jgi:hypothetical protein
MSTMDRSTTTCRLSQHLIIGAGMAQVARPLDGTVGAAL